MRIVAYQSSSELKCADSINGLVIYLILQLLKPRKLIFSKWCYGRKKGYECRLASPWKMMVSFQLDSDADKSI